MMENMDPAKLVGKMVRDEWGQQIGMVVSILANDKGDTKWLLIRTGDGQFRRIPTVNVISNGPDVVVLSSLKKRAEALCRKIAFLRKERAFLSGLGEGSVGSETLADIRKEFKRKVDQVESEARYLLKKIEEACRRCTDQIRYINMGIVHLEVERDMGNISEETFGVSMKLMLSGLKKLMAERDDLLEARRKLLEALKDGISLDMRAGEGPIDVEVEGGEENAHAIQT